MAQFNRRFPAVKLFDIEALLTQIQQIVDRVVLAVEFMFVFTLVAGVLVIFSTLQLTQDERLREGAILRAFGASRQFLLRGALAEFVALGLVAGLLAALGASGTGYLLAEYLFDIDYGFNPWVVVWGLCLGGLGVGIAGMLGMRRVLESPPMETLRLIGS